MHDEVRKHMQQIGRKGGNVNKAKGPEYFRKIRAVRTENERKRAKDKPVDK